MRNRMSTPMRILKNFSVRFLGRILSIVISIVVMGMLGRHMGEAGYGEYTFWYNLIFVVQMFTDIGLQIIIVREIAKCREKISIHFGDAIILKVALSTLFILVVILAAWLVVPDPSVPFLIVVALAATIQPSQDISIWIFRGIEAMEYEAILTVFSQIIWIGCIYLFLTQDLGLAFLLAAQLIANVLRILLGLTITLAKGIRPSFRFDMERYKRLLKDSFPVGISFVIGMAFTYVNIALLKWLARSEDIASFNVGMVLTSGFLFLAITLTTSFFPVFSRYMHEKDERLPSLYAHLSKYLVIISAPITIGLVFLADEIIELVFHQGFSDSVLCLQVLGLTLIIRFFNRMYHFIFPTSNHQIRYLKHGAAAIVANLVISLLLIPKLQFLGACLAFVACEIVLFVLNYFFMSRVISPLPFFEVLVKPVTASLLMGAALFAVKGAHIAVILAVALLTYPVALFFVRAFTLREIEFIREVLRLRRPAAEPAEGVENHD